MYYLHQKVKMMILKPITVQCYINGEQCTYTTKEDQCPSRNWVEQAQEFDKQPTRIE